METKAKNTKKTSKAAPKKATTALDKVVETAQVVNAEVVETTNELVAEVKETGVDFKESVVSGVKEITDTLDIEENVNKIKETAKIVNVQVAETATEIMSDVKETGKKIKEVTTKLAKEAVENIDLTEKMNTVKDAAAKVNLKVKATATEIVDEAVENGNKWSKNAKKAAQNAIENLNITDRIATVKEAAKNANEFALETADELIEGVLSNGEKWQKITNKAVKGGLHLAEKQQDLVLYTLETVKGQALSSVGRLKKLFKNSN